MSTSFIPYGFAHAHLPPPHSPPNSIPEIRIPTVRPYPATSEAFSSPLHPEHAVFAIREPLTGIFARSIHNGYVLELRNLDLFINKDRPKSTEGTEILRIFFPDPLKPLAEGCIVPRLEEGRVFVLVVTQANVIYRLTLGTGDFSPGSGDRVAFNLLAKDEWCEEWEVPDETTTASGGVGAWTVVDEDEVVLGGRDGGIIVCSRSHRWGKHESWTAVHYRASSRLRLPSLFTRSTSEDEVVSFARFDDDPQTTLYALSRDSRLRVWNAENGHLDRTLDLRSVASASRELVLRDPQTPTPSSAGVPTDAFDHAQYVQVIRHPVQASKYTHMVIAFVPSPLTSSSPGTFVVYRVGASGEFVLAGDRQCSSRFVRATLRGFQILSPSDEELAGWRLLVAWDVDGGLAAELVLMDDLFQFTTFQDPGSDFAPVRDWQTVYSGLLTQPLDATFFDNSLSLDPPNAQEPFDNDDIPSTFLTHLFFPGRFSYLSLQTALDDYIRTLAGRNALPQVSAAYPTLSAKFAALVGCELVMRYSSQTGGPEVGQFRRELKLQWLGIWARVTDLDRQARWPVSTSMIDDQVFVFSRECLFSVVPQDTATFVGQIAIAPDAVSDVLSAPDCTFQLALPELVARKTRQTALSVFSCGQSIRSILERSDPEASSSVLESLTDDLDAVFAAGIQEPIENIAGRLFDDYLEENLSADDRASLRSELSECTTAMEGLSTCLVLSSDRSLVAPVEANGSAFSGAGNALIASSLQLNIAVRHRAAVNLLLVALFILAELSDPSGEDDETVGFISVLARVFSAYQRCHILNWVSEQTAEEARNAAWSRRATKRKARADLLSDGLGGLRMQEEAEEELESDGFDPTYSLLHALLADNLVIWPPQDTSNALQKATLEFLSVYRPLHDDNFGLEAGKNDVRLAIAVLTSGMPALALDICEKYPHNASMAYVKGQALLSVERVDESVRCFEQGAAWTRDESIVNLSPAYLGTQGLALYYDVVSKTFDARSVYGPAAHFGQLSLQSGQSMSSTPSEIWTRIFFAYIHLGSFEDAYSTMTRVPSDLSLRRDFLSQLISAMCEANEVGRLTALGFVGIQTDVEEMLGYKARNSDPLKFPNYYKVLYTWHISRGDYRSAGEIMYLQGRRFASAGSSSKVTVFDLLAMQGRSYLAAINALSLVDKRSAWISVARPPHEAKRVGTLTFKQGSKTELQASKRRRTTTLVPKEEFQNRPAIDLLTLDDIQAEYTLVLTRLELARHIDDFYQHGVTVSPEEVVGLLVQRGMYDLAQSAATTLQVDKTDLFQSLAKRCVEFSRQRDPVFTPAAAFLKTSPVTGGLRGPPAALALRYLQTALARHDSAETSYKYRHAVAEMFFELNLDKNAGWRMPQWLVSWEMERDPEGWIALALKWGWVEESLEWSASLLREATPPELLPKRRADTTLLPWNLFDRLLEATTEGDEKDDASVQAKAKQLKTELDRRKQGLDMVAHR